jgi:hypothetical protein
VNKNTEKIITIIETLEGMSKEKQSFRIRRMLSETIDYLYSMIDVMEEER